MGRNCNRKTSGRIGMQEKGEWEKGQRKNTMQRRDFEED
jgi:hypothetical protein